MFKLTAAVTSQADLTVKMSNNTPSRTSLTQLWQTYPEAACVHLKPSPSKIPQVHAVDHLNLSTESMHITWGHH